MVAEHRQPPANSEPGRISSILPPKWTVVLSWTLATAAGAAIAGSLIGSAWAIEKVSLWWVTLGYGVPWGFAIGILQALVLRLPLKERVLWVLATGMSWTLVGSAGLLLVYMSGLFFDSFYGPPWPTTTTFLILIAVGAISTGGQQQLIFLRYLRPTRYWIWGSVVGWGVGSTALLILNVVRASATLKGALAGALGGTLVGLVTGTLLAWMKPVAPR